MHEVAPVRRSTDIKLRSMRLDRNSKNFDVGVAEVLGRDEVVGGLSPFRGKEMEMGRV